MKKFTVRAAVAALALTLVLPLASCGSNEPCADCGRTPTKGYHNDYTGETEYYCDSCSHGRCAFCSNQATRSMTALGQVAFVCDDCYGELHGN